MANRGLIIAIEKYSEIQGLGDDLPGTTAAGVAFREWLLETKKVAPENILFCTEDTAAEGRTSGASIENLVDAIAKLARDGKDHTQQLYVFFSGHGFLFREDSRKRAADVLLAADFSSLLGASSGRKVLRLDEVQSKLQLAMGPEDHFYFIDACRNELDTDQIDVAGSGLNLGHSNLGYPTVYTLYSTNRGAAAALQSHFSEILVEGLRGAGRAKSWRSTGEDEMEVTHSSLREYVKEKLSGQETDAKVEGEGRGVILEIRPAPRYDCTIEVTNGDPDIQFALFVKNSRGQLIGGPRIFKGTRHVFSEPPDFYYLSLMVHGGRALEPQIVKADLWAPCIAQFTMVPFPLEVVFGIGGGPVPEEARPEVGDSRPAVLQVAGLPSTTLSVEDILSGHQEPLSSGATRSLSPGRYLLRMRDSEGVTVRRREVVLEAGGTSAVDLTRRQDSPVREVILSHLPPDAYDQGTVSFSESLGQPMVDDDLGLWLAILGASRIVRDVDSFSKLQRLNLATFEDVQPGGSTIYVLAGRDGLIRMQVGVATSKESPAWRETNEVVQGFSGFRHIRVDHEPGPVLLSLAADRETPLTVASHCLSNRATLVVAADGADGGLRVQQYLLPLHHLEANLNPTVRERLHSNPLEMVRFITFAQRQFARKRAVAIQENVEGWNRLLSGKWLDPMMAILASYELARRGRRESMKTVISNLRQFFVGLPDAEALAKLSGESFERPMSVPLVLDGLLAFDDYAEFLPFPEGKLDFTGPWTAWRGVVSH